RLIAAAGALAVVLSACGGGGKSVPGVPNSGKTSQSSAQTPAQVGAEAIRSQQSLFGTMVHAVGRTTAASQGSAFANQRRVRDLGGSLPAITANILWEVDLAGKDRMSTNSSQERLQSQRYSDGTSWYLPAFNNAGTLPLYRLWASWLNDHMDSNNAGEGGFATGPTMGYPFASQVAGTDPVNRFRDPARPNGDHATPPVEEYPAILNLGYVQEGPMGYGYSRFGGGLGTNATFAAGGITAQVKRFAGGAVWSWQWNGQEFVNNTAGLQYVVLGGSIQEAFFYNNGSFVQNPTEAGDGVCCSPYTSQYLEDVHGSPTASFAITSGGTGASTRSIPLDWDQRPFGASAADQVVVYKDVQMGKDIQLNYNNMGPVAKWTSYLTLPNAVPGASMEIPTGYMLPDLNTYWTYDAGSNALTQVQPPLNGDCTTNGPYTFVPATGYGGVIISNPSGTKAQGVYGASTAVAGSAGYFALYDFISNNCSFKFSKWDIVTPTQTFPAGTSTYNAWIVTGSLTSVQQQMNQLYGQGAR
ncbi:MAG: hypothetical protein QOJ39_3713, partial [Candidatus Eremiobacteraeota bacterium]|nr:hypothetical protein [Candidatus Eremiobacteraeota bacterium]